MSVLFYHFIACKEDSVRLVGSSNSYEGTIEICVDKLWGLVASTAWNGSNAAVVCDQLGFQKQGIYTQGHAVHGSVIVDSFLYRSQKFYRLTVWQTKQNSTSG